MKKWERDREADSAAGRERGEGVDNMFPLLPYTGRNNMITATLTRSKTRRRRQCTVQTRRAVFKRNQNEEAANVCLDFFGLIDIETQAKILCPSKRQKTRYVRNDENKHKKMIV